MGHHWDTENAMPLTYSRDAFSSIMEKLYKVVVAIRDGHFQPDASRAARIAAATGGSILLSEDAMDPPEEDPVVEAPEHDSDVEPEDMEGCEKRLGNHPDGDEAERLPFPQHKVSGIVHLISSDDLLHCGRRKTSNMVPPKFKQKWPANKRSVNSATEPCFLDHYDETEKNRAHWLTKCSFSFE